MSVKIIGMMSGTSLDGIDVCLVEFTETNFNVIEYIEINYDIDIKEKVKKAINGKMSLSELTSLDYELGYQFAKAVKCALEEWKLTSQDIDLIANHGQTIYHNDNKPNTIASTMQLGCGDIIKTELNIDVVTNFRSADIAVGNKGAPLVQIFDDFLISQINMKDVNFLNIGGIANIYIGNKNLAFDTGPGNMMINCAMKELFDKEYDPNGSYAQKGTIQNDLLNHLLDHSYFKMNNQLSTGREDFGEAYTKQVLKNFSSIDKTDIVTTFTEFTAETIARQCIKYGASGTIYISGGGIHNKTLVSMISNKLPGFNVESIGKIGINPNAKEAIAFAYFGYANYKNIKLKTLNGKKTILGVYHKKG